MTFYLVVVAVLAFLFFRWGYSRGYWDGKRDGVRIADRMPWRRVRR